MLSLSVSGRSAHVTTTAEKIILGSGEKGLICDCRRRAIELVIHCVVTTGIIRACDSMNWGKSIVLEMMCVTFSMGSEPSRRGSQIVAPLSSKIADNWKSVSMFSICKQKVLTNLSDQLGGEFVTRDKRDGAFRKNGSHIAYVKCKKKG